MSKEVTVAFDVMATVEQSIDIHTDDTPEAFVEKLNKGEYFTTLEYPSNEVMNLEGIVVGTIVDSIVQSHSEYRDFEVK